MFPFLEPEGIHAIMHTPTDLYLEPVQIPLGYARAAGRLGATLVPNTTVTAIVSRNGFVERVITDHGVIRTPVVVDAAGAVFSGAWPTLLWPSSRCCDNSQCASTAAGCPR